MSTAKQGISAKEAYSTMSNALKVAGRPIVFSLCEWGDNQPWNWAKNMGHLWRISGDIYHCFDCVVDHGGGWKDWGVTYIIDMRKNIRQYSGPDHWNDFDMMEVGNGMAAGEDRAHFSMWCMLASPLIAGNDLRSMSETTRSIITNKNVIAINQDKLGVQALKIFSEGALQIWVKPLEKNEWAILFLNRGKQPLAYTHEWRPLRDDFSKRSVDFTKTTYQWLDVWSKAEGNTQQPLTKEIGPNSVFMLRLKPKK